MGVAGYSEMARMLGLNDVADKYAAIAKKMAVKWEEMANEGDHYRLAFDRKDTWSQKYNMVWDKLWNLNLFPNNVIRKEINYYLTKQNPYGLLWTLVKNTQNPTGSCGRQLCLQIRKPSRNSLILSINISMKQYHVCLSVTGTTPTVDDG